MNTHTFDPKRIAVIGACMDDGSYGLGNRMPWKPKDVPGDLGRFKDITGATDGVNWLIAGMKTFESMKDIDLGPKRKLIGVSRTRQGTTPEKHIVLNTFEGALRLAEISGVDKVFFIGGEECWTYGFSVASLAYVTQIRGQSSHEEAKKLSITLDEMARTSGMELRYSKPVLADPVEFEFQTWQK